MAHRSHLLVAALAFVLAGCPNPKPATGIFAEEGQPIPTATAVQKATFARGRLVAARRFGPAEGLGPAFNVTFCAACHEKPNLGGSAPRYRNFDLVDAGPPGGRFPLGKSGIQELYDPTNGNYVPLEAGTEVIATRNGTPFYGLGLLAEIPDHEILSNADPDDKNGDGISGRPNSDQGFLGRFGRKAQTASLEGFVRGPLFNHLGITTDPLPPGMKAKLPVPSNPAGTGSSSSPLTSADGLGSLVQGQASAPEAPLFDDDGVPDPELSSQDLFDLVSWVELLAAPKPDAPTSETQAGEKRFASIGCTGCHVPALDGPRGLVPAYTDLLLHDMGPGLADGIEQGVATGSEFRTEPLWGIAATAPYLHDGRADTIDEAIRFHGGEAQASRDAYVGLSASDQKEIVDFLMSLGGRDLSSPGLLPPNAPAPQPGTLGGPIATLSATDEQKFLRGRADFDADVTLAAGLGPGFNGDGCRACHSSPVQGGGGPLGVNVIRQGIVDASGGFTAPTGGTMLHRLTTQLDGRNAPDPASNVFELRQAPPLFGLGLVDRIPDATIEAHADPTDADGNGIRGVAQILKDGRLGRFGWKAQFPSLAEFLRDATRNEEGLTNPDQPGLTFGSGTDNDGVPDPEIDTGTLADLLFYMQQLAPPPPHSTDPTTEAQGKTLFTQVGCDLCHIPTMQTADGTPVNLYSDLLLHDTSPAGTPGIAAGKASMTMFRTAPLWGVRDSAPYMHDGRAETLDDAIRMHDGEATASRQKYAALSSSDQAALVAFLKSL